METENIQAKQVSALQDDVFYTSRILTRETSIDQSSRIFYRAADGIPFKWEMEPGTPKNPQEEDTIPPLSPSPLMQSLSLPLPNFDHDHEAKCSLRLKISKIWSFKKMVKRSHGNDKDLDGPFCCSPWKVSAVQVRVARRV